MMRATIIITADPDEVKEWTQALYAEFDDTDLPTPLAIFKEMLDGYAAKDHWGLLTTMPIQAITARMDDV